jgi:hypothetical protein
VDAQQWGVVWSLFFQGGIVPLTTTRVTDSDRVVLQHRCCSAAAWLSGNSMQQCGVVGGCCLCAAAGCGLISFQGWGGGAGRVGWECARVCGSEEQGRVL